MSSSRASKRVVVAHDAAPIREAALRVVREAGYEALGVGDGESVRLLLATAPAPAALVIDVGLPGLHGYELVAEVRRRGLSVRVVLIASVYSRTAYKRQPTKLYGADDYIEQHHIVDKLAPKLAALLADRVPAWRNVHVWDDLSAQEKHDFENIRDAGEGRLAFALRGQVDRAEGAPAGGPASPDREAAVTEEGLEKARSLARLIVADLALYRGDVLGNGLVVDDVERQLAGDLGAARALFLLRVPAEIAETEDFMLAALREFLAARTRRD